MSEVTQVEKQQHFEEMERVGQVNLFEYAHQQEKLKVAVVKEQAQEPIVEQATDSAQDEPTPSDGEQIEQIGEREAENGEQNKPDGEQVEQNGATLIEQAIAKIEADMKNNKNPYVQAVGQFLIEFLKQRPDTAEQILQNDKSISKSLEAMCKEAEKRKVGNYAVLTSEEGFEIVLKYYGIQGGVTAPSVDASQVAKQLADKMATQVQQQDHTTIAEQTTTTEAVEKAKIPGKLSFDVGLDDLL